MNDLEHYFQHNDKRLIHKWMHYFEVYDRHFGRYRNQKIHILEIGVSQGGSLQMWKHYFGPLANIYGIDIDPRCKQLEEPGIQIFIGSQQDPQFLKEVCSQIPAVDILIDDGGHTMRQQIVTFECLFDHVKSDGIYLCEDLHTSYWLRYGGGHKRRGTFIEYSKNFIDKLHGWHSQERSLGVDLFSQSVHSVHYYDSIMVLEKRPTPAPHHRMTGQRLFPNIESAPTGMARLRLRAKNALLLVANKVLRGLRLPGWIWR